MSQVNATFAIAKPMLPAVERKCCVERRFPLGMPHVSANMHSTVCTPWRSRNSRAASTSSATVTVKSASLLARTGGVIVTPSMRAVVLRSFNAPLELEEREAPAPRHEDERVVRVLACGVCHSDLHVVENFFGTELPIVLGHEIVAHDDELGNVLVYTPWGCGECRFCRRSEEMICPDAREAGMFQDGGYADYVRVPARRYLYPIGDLDPVEAAPLGCGGLTPYRAVKHARTWLGPGSRALVLGAGGLGQFGIQYLRLLTDAAVHVGDPSAQK